MGTRADFYIGRGKDAKWIGSKTMDGYPDGIPDRILCCGIEKDYADALRAYLEEVIRKDGSNQATLPEEGWPWPWKDSRTTDYAYAFDGDKVWASSFGGTWFDPTLPEPEDDDNGKVAVFPQFKPGDRGHVMAKSGMVVIAALPR